MITLLIDDSFVTRDIFRLVFEHYDQPLVTVADAESAFNFLECHIPSIIVVDLYMNNMDGWCTLQHLRAMGYMGPVVATTSYHTSKVWGQSLVAGFDGYMPKPLDVTNIVPYLMMISNTALAT